jgi:hypothetical protein
VFAPPPATAPPPSPTAPDADAAFAPPRPEPWAEPGRPDVESEAPPTDLEFAPGAPAPAPVEAAGEEGQRELSISELLDEELPIPAAAMAEQPQPEPEREWLDDLLDEDFPIPEPALADPSGLAPAEPPEEAVPQPEPQAVDDDFLPPPPPRLLRNLFEPDPDDPLVQAMQAAEAERDNER